MDVMSSNVLGRLYRDGQIIVRQGELGDCMYVVVEGKVEVLQRKEEQEFCLAVLEKGDFVGEMCLFDQNVRTTTVRALGDAILMTVESAHSCSACTKMPRLHTRFSVEWLAASATWRPR